MVTKISTQISKAHTNVSNEPFAKQRLKNRVITLMSIVDKCVKLLITSAVLIVLK